MIEASGWGGEVTVIFAEVTPTGAPPLGGVIKVRPQTRVRLQSLVDGAAYSVEVGAEGFLKQKKRIL